MSGVSPAKSNVVIHERDEPAIGDCHAMRVGTEVAKHLLRSAEGWFAIDDPPWDEELADETPEQLGLSQASESAVELKLSGSVGLLERFDKFAAEDLAENPHGKKEIVPSWVYPVRVIPRQAAGGHDAVNMRMMLELLIPGVKDTEKADLGAEMSGVGGNFKQCVGTGAEDQSVDHSFVLQSKRCQLVGEREDDMSIGCGKQFRASGGKPTIARLVLTLWAVPVAAGNGDLPITCLMGSIF
jgi:hypothetical protein